MEISSSVIIAEKKIVVKETKTDRVRRVAIDRFSAVVVAEHRARCEERASACGTELRPRSLMWTALRVASLDLGLSAARYLGKLVESEAHRLGWRAA